MEEELFLENNKLILFDGVCNLCDASVQYIIRHDTKDIFRFAPLESDIGRRLLKENNIDSSKMDSILLFNSTKLYFYKSSAALRIVKRLGFPRNLLSLFLIIPPFIRNWVYDYIANHRYEWYGKKDECMIPSPEIKNKFLG